MNPLPLVILPGFYTEHTDRDAKNRWKDGNHVRFNEEYPEKIGGSVRVTGSAFLGYCRRMLAFRSLTKARYLAMGTHLKLYIWDDGDMVNITPFQATGTLGSDPFSSTAASAVITVADTSHGLNAGDTVYFDGATVSPIDGLNIDGEYTVTSVIDANTYTITHSVVATNSEANFGGSSVDYDYELGIGLADSGFGTGWGASTWGTGTWGTPRGGSGLFTPARTWAMASWGEDVMFNPRGGTIYVFDTSAGINTSNRAAIINNAPDTVEFILVSAEDRYLIAFGAHDGSGADPMLVRWSSQEDYTDWTPTAINTAGDRRLDSGSAIITAIQVRKQILILTDTSAVSMFPVDYPVLWDFDTLDDSCGAVSPNCAVAGKNGAAYWMGTDNFYYFDGSVGELHCDVHSYVFSNINRTQLDKVICGTCASFSEVWWGYCSASSVEIDRYVIYNYEYNIWYYGTWTRTAYIDKGKFQTVPMAAGSDMYLYLHETGVDDNTNPLVAYIKSYDAEIGEGEKFSHTRHFIPDFKRLSGSLDMTLTAKRYPQSTETVTKGPETIVSDTEKIDLVIRGRQVSLEIESDELGDDWRMGPLRVDVVAHGGA